MAANAKIGGLARLAIGVVVLSYYNAKHIGVPTEHIGVPTEHAGDQPPAGSSLNRDPFIVSNKS